MPPHVEPSARSDVLLNPTPDQSLFQETTATFLDELVPVDVLPRFA